MPDIIKLSVYSHCNELGGKVWNPAIRWTRKHAVFVVLEDSAGNKGLGECWCFDSSPDALIAFLRTEVAPHIVGSKLGDNGKLLKPLLRSATLSARHGILASALSGVDIALWDLRSRHAHQPLWRYLSNVMELGTANGCAYLYASGGLYGENKSIADLVAEMQAMQNDGFDTVKMKIGGLSLEQDLERVHAVLDGLAKTSRVIIDGVYTYSPEAALHFYESLPGSRVVAFQSPINASNIAGMKMLTASGVPVMATEAEYRAEIHSSYVNDAAVRYLQVAPVACGGITRLIELSHLLDQTDIKLSLEVSSTAVALLGAMHFAAAYGTVAHTEYHYVHQVFFNDLDIQQARNSAGVFQLSDAAGIGINLPEAHVSAAFSVDA